MAEASDDHNRFCTIVFECDIRKTKGNPFHIDTPFGRPVIISKGDQLSEDDEEFYDYVDNPDEERSEGYNENWNSPENAKRRLDAAWDQVKRDWNRHKGDIYEFLVKPLGWALAVPTGFVVAVWFVRRISS